MKFENLVKDVKSITVFFLRSYGVKWKGSAAEFVATATAATKGGDAAALSKKTIKGSHDDEEYKYSLTFSETMDLTDVVQAGETIEIFVRLIGGKHFKLMGLM